MIVKIDGNDIECKEVKIKCDQGIAIQVMDRGGLVYLGGYERDAVCTITPYSLAEWKGLSRVATPENETDKQQSLFSIAEQDVPQGDGESRDSGKSKPHTWT